MKALALLLFTLSLGATLLPKIAMAADLPGAGDFVQAHSGTLVLIKDTHGAGSGFLATQGGVPYLFTNIHVAAHLAQPEFTLLDGTRLFPATAEAAVGHDIMRFTLRAPPRDSLPTAENMASTVRVGDPVFVFGNSGGGGVVTSLPGIIAGIGPDRLEVTSAFIPGNSGSPIIHAPTGRVIGIATYLTRRPDEFSAQRSGPDNFVVRRFGFRLDSVQKWEPVNWAGFRAEAEQMQRVADLTEDLINFLTALSNKAQPALATEALRRPATEWHEKLGRPHIAEADRVGATQAFLGSLRLLAMSDVNALTGRLHYSYFATELEKQRETRAELYKGFDEEFKVLSSPSSRGR